MIEGLRDFLKRLEGRGELIRIRKEVDPRFEVAALIRDIQQRRNQPVLFERVKGSTLPIVSNTCGSYASVSAALGVEPRDLSRIWAERLTHAAALPSAEAWAFALCRTWCWRWMGRGSASPRPSSESFLP